MFLRTAKKWVESRHKKQEDIQKTESLNHFLEAEIF